MNKKVKKYIKSDYFDYNGNRYYIGTRFIINYKNVHVTAHFIGKSFKDQNIIDIIIDNGLKYPTMTSLKESDFQKMIIEILPISWYDEMERRKKYVNDSDMPELIIGWMLYIFIMVGSSIFNGREYGWILITVLFFWWRHNIKEECGAYYDKRR